MAEIINVIIAAGLEKLVSGSITDIVSKTRRKDVDQSMGMAVGLTSVVGRIITEQDPIPLIGNVSCTL
jgi:hypothetical protein